MAERRRRPFARGLSDEQVAALGPLVRQSRRVVRWLLMRDGYDRD